MNYLKEFPMFDDVLPSIEGFCDSSWHNDSCPSLTKELPNGDMICFYIDYKNKKLSDFADLEGDLYKRFRLYLYPLNREDDYKVLKESDDLNDILKFIASIN